MKVEVKIIKAFSIGHSGGNPAGVVVDADNLSREQKQQVAARVGLSETAFVSASRQADVKLDFFTPTRQIAHCGHATIATFTYLKQAGRILNDLSSKETIDGNRSIFFKDGNAYMEQKAPEFLPLEIPMDLILQSLGITEADLIPGQLPMIVNTGNSFLIVPVKDSKVLAGLRPDYDVIASVSSKAGLIGYYVYTPTFDGSLQATTRMFAPYYGIEEESATGMAAGPLAGMLYRLGITEQEEILIEQGRYMQPASPSLIRVHLDLADGKIRRLFAGGHAYVAGVKLVEL
ncbi:PhzF family phenazine biosynthesis protein [Flavihumibacter rivuli]|uniref:PhzF family phenazine biosynthesis protein n=1 Tax=Flavihumibacter rivuli TaxID=2838156 RepID=UPI001BDF51A7|nr:PhzF family phenazine biosynthesis protein [Flavihumibacter rivuli]ULQ56010.1 PhzF family phenazine biosynthesis protein [Flavihumibacter rivuli]